MAILREHGGQIQAQPLSDGGSVFTVTLPIAQGNAKFLAESPAEVQRPPSPSEQLAGSLILVVDDEESIRELVSEGLTARRIRVDTAASADEAISLMQMHSYDAVLCDLNLQSPSGHVSSGHHLHDHIVKTANGANNRNKPFFLFMTGELLDGPGREVSHLGVRALQKPFRISELIAILTEALVGLKVR